MPLAVCILFFVLKSGALQVLHDGYLVSRSFIALSFAARGTERARGCLAGHVPPCAATAVSSAGQAALAVTCGVGGGVIWWRWCGGGGVGGGVAAVAWSWAV